jgi:hypothetical protein
MLGLFTLQSQPFKLINSDPRNIRGKFIGNLLRKHGFELTDASKFFFVF